MAGRPGPATLFAKWLVIPVLVGLAGYFFVGPKIGKVVPKPSSKDAETGDTPVIGHSVNGDTTVSDSPATTERVSHQTKKKTAPEPDLDISVRADGSDATRPRPARANAPAEAPPDPSTGAQPDAATARTVAHRRRPKPAVKPAKQPEENANTPVVNQGTDAGSQGDQGGSAGSTTAGGQ